MKDAQAYIATDTYHELLDKLEDLFATFDAAAPDDLRTRLIMILGEEGGIWPASSRNGADATARHPIPDTFIPDKRFHALIDCLKEIHETDDEARDKAVQFILMDIGRLAPASSRSYYE